MTTVLLGRDTTGAPHWTPAVWRLAPEVGFQPELGEPGAAQPKGSVENLVRWVKTNFVPSRRFTDDEELAAQSLAWERAKNGQIAQAHGSRPVELLPPEQAAFGPLPTAAPYGLYRVATVNGASLVRVAGNQYSVPVGHGGYAVDVRLLREAVRVSRHGQLLAERPRSQGGHRRREPAHYLPALDERPRARLVLEREQLCSLGPEETAYVPTISQRRRRALAAELAACTTVLTPLGANGFSRAAAACVTRGLCGTAPWRLFADMLTGRRCAEGKPPPTLSERSTPPEVDRDLALSEAFVGR